MALHARPDKDPCLSEKEAGLSSGQLSTLSILAGRRLHS